jgi:hypothetical protein
MGQSRIVNGGAYEGVYGDGLQGSLVGNRKVRSEVERIPYGRTWVENRAQKRIERVPIERSATDVIQIEHTIDHIPYTTVEKTIENQPVERYYPTTEYLPVHRSYVRSVGSSGGNLGASLVMDNNVGLARPLVCQ